MVLWWKKLANIDDGVDGLVRLVRIIQHPKDHHDARWVMDVWNRGQNVAAMSSPNSTQPSSTIQHLTNFKFYEADEADWITCRLMGEFVGPT